VDSCSGTERTTAPRVAPSAETAPIRPVSFGRRLSQLAEARGDETAAVFVTVTGRERRLRWGELDRQANRLARAMAERGVSRVDAVVVGLPQCPEHVIATFAAWKLGACVIPLRPDLPVRERAALLNLSEAAAVIANWPEVSMAWHRAEVCQPGSHDDAPLPEVVPECALAIASGGSTGRPKLIETPLPATTVPGHPMNPLAPLLGLRPGQVTLVTTPASHVLGFGLLYASFFDDRLPIVVERFDPDVILDLVERRRVNYLTLVPTTMQRLLRATRIAACDLSSTDTLLHTAAPCPPWVKQGWIDLLGPEKVIEVYSSTEQVGMTVVTGVEWLARPGTVGKGVMTEIRILDESGHELPPGQVGEIFTRLAGLPEPLYRYRGAERGPVTGDGFASVGDLGWLDDDGYLYIADRRDDLIITGGANVFPAEVEAALSEHPDVVDVAVVGVPDPEWGQRVHAVIEPRPAGAPATETLLAWCRERLAPYKVPKSFSIVDQLPRSEAGKIRRSELAHSPSMVAGAGRRETGTSE